MRLSLSTLAPNDFARPLAWFPFAAPGILLVAFALRLIGLDKGIWLDEASSLNLISQPNFLQQLWNYGDQPLYFPLLKLWSFVGSGEPFYRFLSVIFGMGTVAVIITWLKPYSQLAGILAGLYCATLPIMLRYSQEVRHYATLVFLTALSFYFADRLMRAPNKGSNYVGLGLSLATAMATHVVTVMLVPSVCTYIILQQRGWKSIRIVQMVLVFFAPFLVFALMWRLMPHFTQQAQSWWVPPISSDSLLDITRQELGINQARWVWWFIANRFSGGSDWLNALLLRNVDVFILALPIALAFAFGKWKRALPFLAAALAYWGAMLAYSVLVLPIEIARTMMPGMVPLIGFVGMQITTTRLPKLKLGLVAGLLLLCSIFAVNWIRNEAHTPIEAWKPMTALMESTRQPEDLVVLYPDFVSLGLEYYDQLPAANQVMVSSLASPDEVKDELSARIGQRKGSDNHFAIFVLYRDVGNIRSQLELYTTLSSLLESQFGAPLLSVKQGTLTLTKYEYVK
jgi:4-amino-4-deoxy-L-arabinose transferase-like glycosyltransferase